MPFSIFKYENHLVSSYFHTPCIKVQRLFFGHNRGAFWWASEPALWPAAPSLPCRILLCVCKLRTASKIQTNNYYSTCSHIMHKWKQSNMYTWNKWITKWILDWCITSFLRWIWIFSFLRRWWSSWPLLVGFWRWPTENCFVRVKPLMKIDEISMLLCQGIPTQPIKVIN